MAIRKESFVDFNNLIIKIDYRILGNIELSINEKLILGLDFTLKGKKGFNQLLNTEVAELLNLHYNTVSSCRKNLVDKGYLTKSKLKYKLTNKYSKYKAKDKRNILIIDYIYKNKNLTTGSKLLWGEYNSMSNNDSVYFASREYSSIRLGCSIGSITKWTKELLEEGLIEYELNSGYASKQKVVVVKDIEQYL